MEYKWIAQDKYGCIAKYIDKPRIDGCEFFEFPIEVIQKTTFITVKGWENSLINLSTHDYKIEDGILMQVEKEQKIFKGSELQYRSDDGSWYDCGHAEYRLKPKTKIVRFRNFLNIDGNARITTKESTENEAFFYKWIGDWQKVEVEIEQ